MRSLSKQKAIEHVTKGSVERTTSPTNKKIRAKLNKSYAGPPTSQSEKKESGKIEYDSAYTELAKKLYMKRLHNQSGVRKALAEKVSAFDTMLSPHAAREIENRRTIASKELQDTIAARLLKYGDDLHEHSKALVEAYLEKEIEECTFNPKITRYGNSEHKRSKEQFLQDQSSFLQLVEEKKQKLKEKIASEKKLAQGTYKPELNQKSLKIVQKRRKLSAGADIGVHSRLHELKTNARQKQMLEFIEDGDEDHNNSNVSSQFMDQASRMTHHLTDQAERESTFKPNILQKSKDIKREVKIDAALYSDAMRRQRKSMDYVKKVNQKTPVKQNTISESSQKALAMRFIREYEIITTELKRQEHKQNLDYIQLGELLKVLSFIKEYSSPDHPQFVPERNLLYDLWFTLHADKYNGIHRRNLLVFLTAVLGLHFEITKIHKTELNPADGASNEGSEEQISPKKEVVGPPEEKDTSQRERRIIGQFDGDGNLVLSRDDVDKIHKLYNLWFINRLGSKDNLAQIIASRQHNESNHQPIINEKSRNMAQLYRERILEGTSELIQQNKIPVPKDTKLTHADLLVFSKKIVDEKVERIKAGLDGIELQNCTFKPAINENYKAQMTKIGPLGGDQDGLEHKRYERLYALRKPAIDKKNREAIEIDYEKNCNECTFEPDMRKNPAKVSGMTAVMAKNIEKTIYRLRYGNEVREQKNLNLQRGSNTQQSDSRMSFSLERDSKSKISSQRSTIKGSTKKSTRPGSMGQSLWEKHNSNMEVQLYPNYDNGKFRF